MLAATAVRITTGLPLDGYTTLTCPARSDIPAERFCRRLFDDRAAQFNAQRGERPKDALPVSDCSATSDPSGFRTRDLRIKSSAGALPPSCAEYRKVHIRSPVTTGASSSPFGDGSHRSSEFLVSWGAYGVQHAPPIGRHRASAEEVAGRGNLTRRAFAPRNLD
jgi:hypothetical protein